MMPRRKAPCPHAQAQDCPLYWASHCAAGRSLDYTAALARLQAADPRLVAECAFRREERAARAQRARNVRAAGLH